MSRVMLSCGEPSGDLYAAQLARALTERRPGIDVFGFGGPQCEAAGVRLVGRYAGLSVTGLTEALRVLPATFAMLRRLIRAARDTRPDVARPGRLSRLQLPPDGRGRAPGRARSSTT